MVALYDNRDLRDNGQKVETPKTVATSVVDQRRETELICPKKNDFKKKAQYVKNWGLFFMVNTEKENMIMSNLFVLAMSTKGFKKHNIVILL